MVTDLYTDFMSWWGYLKRDDTALLSLSAALDLTGLQNTHLKHLPSITAGLLLLMCGHGGITQAQVQ
jgi:hypothetical protein